jgi:hypothetical protein
MRRCAAGLEVGDFSEFRSNRLLTRGHFACLSPSGKAFPCNLFQNSKIGVHVEFWDAAPLEQIATKIITVLESYS